MSSKQVCRLGRSKPTNFFHTSSPPPLIKHKHKHKQPQPQLTRIPRRFFSSPLALHATPPKPTPISATSFASSRSRLQNRLRTLQSRLPKFLHRYTAPLLDAPKTYIISFLVLHEVTAIVPLILLAGGFHYTGWLPSDLIPEEKLEAARGRFERWFRRRGWLDNEGTSGYVDRVGHDGQLIQEARESNTSGRRIVLEVATAYVITKVLLPLRIGVCVWGTPWFAGVVARIGRLGRGAT